MGMISTPPSLNEWPRMERTIPPNKQRVGNSPIRINHIMESQENRKKKCHAGFLEHVHKPLNKTVGDFVSKLSATNRMCFPDSGTNIQELLSFKNENELATCLRSHKQEIEQSPYDEGLIVEGSIKQHWQLQRNAARSTSKTGVVKHCSRP